MARPNTKPHTEQGHFKPFNPMMRRLTCGWKARREWRSGCSAPLPDAALHRVEGREGGRRASLKGTGSRIAIGLRSRKLAGRSRRSARNSKLAVHKCTNWPSSAA
jgi:hypothetical protein